MIQSNYLSYLLALIKTKAYADQIIASIDELKGCLYNKRVDLDKKMSELFTFELKEKIKAYSWAEQVNLNDPESFAGFLSNLRSIIKSMPVVTIQIAFPPSAEIVKEVADWFVENYGKNVLVETQFDKDLIAGAVVTFDQKSKDFSLKKRIEAKYKAEDWIKFVSKVRQKIQDRSNGEAIQSIAQSI